MKKRILNFVVAFLISTFIASSVFAQEDSPWRMYYSQNVWMGVAIDSIQVVDAPLFGELLLTSSGYEYVPSAFSFGFDTAKISGITDTGAPVVIEIALVDSILQSQVSIDGGSDVFLEFP